MRRWLRELGDVAAGLVHPRVRASVSDASVDARFIASRLVYGAVILLALPPVVALRDEVPMALLIALVGSLAFIVSALLVSRRGDRANGCIVSAAGLCLMVTGLWTAGIVPPALALAWLLLAPVDCLLAGSRRALPTATVMAALAALLLVSGLTTAPGIALLAASLAQGWPILAVFLPALIVVSMACAHGLSQIDTLQGDRRSQDELMGKVVAAFADLVTTHDKAGQVLTARKGRASRFDLDPHALVGSGLFGRIHIGDRPAYLKCLSDAARGGGVATAVVRLRSMIAEDREPDDPFMTVRMHAEALTAAVDGGDIVCVYSDLSEQIVREQAERNLRVAAEQATVAKDRFLATVSHELRTPLNAIIGFAEILTGDTIGDLDEARRREYAAIIAKSGNHLLEIVNALLDISKIESGKVDLQAEAFDFAALVTNCVELLSLRAEQKNVRIKAEIVDPVSDVVGDRRACRQVLVNLLSNAVKFSPHDSVVMLRLRRVGDTLECGIEDSGIGIAREDLMHLGDPFFQAASAHDRRHEGTGLGLSIVRGLVGLMHGRLTIESSPGEGTLALVALPLDARKVSVPARPTSIIVRPRGAVRQSLPQPMVRKSA